MFRPLRKLVAPSLIVLAIGGVALAGMLGIRLFRVESGSMKPTLPVGTIVLVVPTDELHERDIVTLRVNGKLVTHTFHWETSRGELVTKGDNSLSPDNFNPAPRKEDVIGVVWRQVPIFAPDFWASWRGKLILALGAVLLFLWLVPTKRDSAASQQAPTPA